jgi:hypothetical protein
MDNKELREEFETYLRTLGIFDIHRLNNNEIRDIVSDFTSQKIKSLQKEVDGQCQLLNDIKFYFESVTSPDEFPSDLYLRIKNREPNPRNEVDELKALLRSINEDYAMILSFNYRDKIQKALKK